MSEKRWCVRPEGSNWGDFGPDDQIGRMNLLNSELRLKAIRTVEHGMAFCLSLPLDFPGGSYLSPYRRAPEFHYARRGSTHNFNYPMHLENACFMDVVSDDAVLLHTQYSTQWDGLAHHGQHFDVWGNGEKGKVYYNGYRGGVEIVGPENGAAGLGVRALGIENLATAGVQGRGVLVDLEAVYGHRNALVGHQELLSVLNRQGVEVEPGDFLCIYTGFADILLNMGGKPDMEVLSRSCAALDGRDTALLDWITASGVVALCADNFAVEAYPARPASGDAYAALPLHEHCIFKLGIHLGELWYFAELARCLRARSRNTFLLTAPPLRLPGAVGSPLTPIATV